MARNHNNGPALGHPPPPIGRVNGGRTAGPGGGGLRNGHEVQRTLCVRGTQVKRRWCTRAHSAQTATPEGAQGPTGADACALEVAQGHTRSTNRGSLEGARTSAHEQLTGANRCAHATTANPHRLRITGCRLAAHRRDIQKHSAASTAGPLGMFRCCGFPPAAGLGIQTWIQGCRGHVL